MQTNTTLVRCPHCGSNMPANHVQWDNLAGTSTDTLLGTCPDCKKSAWSERWENAEPSSNEDDRHTPKRGRPAIHGEAMTAAERQAKKRTARMLAIQRIRTSVAEAKRDLNLSDPKELDPMVQSALEQLDLIEMDLGDL